MKKLVLLTTGLLVSASMSAQVLRQDAGKVKRQTPAFGLVNKVQVGENATPKKKTVATGLYYTRPEGVISQDFDIEGSGFYVTKLLPTAFSEYTFVSQGNEVGKWYNGETFDSDMSYDEITNPDGTLTGTLPPGYMWTAPKLATATDAFVYGGFAHNRMDKTGTTYPTLIHPDSVGFHTWHDQHIGHVQGGWSGFNSKYFLFGSGYTTKSLLENMPEQVGEDRYPFFAVSQKLEKPMSPMYVENVVVEAFCAMPRENPIDAGKVVTMTFRKLDGTVVAELTSGHDDYILQDNFSLAPIGQVWNQGKLVFTQKVYDEMVGQEVAAPFVIDDSVEVVITGIDQEGVEVGFPAYFCADEENLRPAFQICEIDGEVAAYSYSGDVACLPLTFTSLNDVCKVLADGQDNLGNPMSNLNHLRVSADGQTCNIDNTQFEGVVVYTGTSWFDGDQNEYYGVADEDNLPDWIEQIVVDDSRWAASDNNPDPGSNVIKIICSPLKSGETGRQAVIYLKGRGVVSDEPIVVLQGDAVFNGIESIEKDSHVSADNNIYNLNGQRVNKSVRGLFIQNGKKVIRK